MKGCTNLYLNLFLTEQTTSQSFAFGKFGEVQGETTETGVTISGRERGRKEGSSDLVQSCGNIFILPQMLHLAK